MCDQKPMNSQLSVAHDFEITITKRTKLKPCNYKTRNVIIKI